MSTAKYVDLARSANRISLLLRRLGGDGRHWQEARARWMALARQERGSAQLWAMIIAVILLGAPAVVMDQQEDAQERADTLRLGAPAVRGGLFEDETPATFDEPVHWIFADPTGVDAAGVFGEPRQIEPTE